MKVCHRAASVQMTNAARGVSTQETELHLEAVREHLDDTRGAGSPHAQPVDCTAKQRRHEEGVRHHSSHRVQAVHDVGEYPDAQKRPERLAFVALTGEEGEQ